MNGHGGHGHGHGGLVHGGHGHGGHGHEGHGHGGHGHLLTYFGLFSIFQLGSSDHHMVNFSGSVRCCFIRSVIASSWHSGTGAVQDVNFQTA